MPEPVTVILTAAGTFVSGFWIRALKSDADLRAEMRADFAARIAAGALASAILEKQRDAAVAEKEQAIEGRHACERRGERLEERLATKNRRIEHLVRENSQLEAKLADLKKTND